MTRANGIRRQPGEKYIDFRTGRMSDDATFIHPHAYRQIQPINWGPIAGPAREEARRRISVREAAAFAACCVR